MNNQVVSQEAWVAARLELMQKEKAFTREREALAEARRELPWVEITQNYVFEGDAGQCSLADLFGDSSQLAVYHFMFGPDAEEGCPICSYWADNYNGTVEHLAARDIRLIAVSRGPLDKLLGYRQRMGWTFDWYSSAGSSFNMDFGVSFDDEHGADGYNFGTSGSMGQEAPGFSVFFKDEDGRIYRTYSTYARGLDVLNGDYHIMDMTPKGRDESGLPYPMAWIKRKDQY